MNIDQPSSAAPALEPSRAFPLRLGEGHTLTLRLELSPIHDAFDAMTGSVSVDVATCPHAFLATVLPADQAALTLTF